MYSSITWEIRENLIIAILLNEMIFEKINFTDDIFFNVFEHIYKFNFYFELNELEKNHYYQNAENVINLYEFK